MKFNDLPINDVLNDIKHALNSNNRVVLQAPPGAGKTTAVPIALLNESWLQDKQIIMLEPRRLAARNAAARMAYLLNEKVGETVGYQIRQDNCTSDRTRILVVTEGILTRRLQSDPGQEKTALVIFDEFHERSLHADLSLALSLQGQQILNEELKILVMSATLNTHAISDLLDNAPVIESEGRSYPVDIHYLDKPLKQAASGYTGQQQLISELINTIKRVIHEYDGNCLVFLPGVKEINQLAASIRQYLASARIENIRISPLHGSLDKQQQDQAISAPPDGQRKIVLATNIAETSLTIEGISCVIDSGLERRLVYNPSSAMNSLKTHFISEDSADQRSGRAGRLSAGVCYRLWTSQQQQRLVKHSVAEILHSDLSSLVLELANWGVRQVEELQWMDLPPASAIEQARALLQQLDAIDSEGRIMQHGRDMLNLGTHPRLAHMMLSAVPLGQSYHACLVASILTEKDLFLASAEKTIDIHDRISVLQQYKLSNSRLQDVDRQQCARVIQTADDFYRRLRQVPVAGSKVTGKDDTIVDSHLTGVLLAYAYPDRIAKQRSQHEARYILSNGKGASMPLNMQQLYEYLVIANLDAMQGKAGQGEANIYLAAEITAQQLEDYFEHIIQRREIIAWNDVQQRVEAKQAVNIGRLVLQEKMTIPEDRGAVQECLLQAIKNIGLQCLDWTEKAQGFRQRVQFINYQITHDPLLEQRYAETGLPDFSDEALMSSLSLWLGPQITTETSIKQCQKLDIYNLLKNLLSWEQQQAVNTLAPEKIVVPSGSAIRIDYSDPAQPVLAVRLQEVFGLYETPMVFDGQCKLMMHLLSPAHRPMQVTQDLKSFWKNTYHEVKKELRGKYKRHYWPDDPFTAQATSKTKKNMDRPIR